ncbi:MAG: hypothetical protein AAF127_00375 [Pseudomonadota bacterium]
MIEIEVQNETHQTQERIRFAAVPRIGEGIRLREPDGLWASYDVLDVWYQKAEYGDIWMPYLHVRVTPGELAGGLTDDISGELSADLGNGLDDPLGCANSHQAASAYAGEAEPFKI